MNRNECVLLSLLVGAALLAGCSDSTESTETYADKMGTFGFYFCAPVEGPYEIRGQSNHEFCGSYYGDETPCEMSLIRDGDLDYSMEFSLNEDGYFKGSLDSANYDSSGRLTELSVNSFVLRFTYVGDSDKLASMMKTCIEEPGCNDSSSRTFEYNDAGHLERQVFVPEGSGEAEATYFYEYNREERTVTREVALLGQSDFVTDKTVVYAFDDEERLESVTEIGDEGEDVETVYRYGYDAEGRFSNLWGNFDYGDLVLTWDSNGRLVEEHDPNFGTSFEYSYDCR